MRDPLSPFRGWHMPVIRWRAERMTIIYDLECGHQLREEVAAGYFRGPREFVNCGKC